MDPDYRAPQTIDQTAYERPYFDPGEWQKILQYMPGVKDISGSTMGYDPSTGMISANAAAGEGSGSKYMNMMKDYVKGTGDDLYEEVVLPSLARRGVISGRGKPSSEESRFTKDWGRMKMQEAEKAGAQGIGMDIGEEQAQRSGLLSQMGLALNAMKGAEGKNAFTHQTIYG